MRHSTIQHKISTISTFSAASAADLENSWCSVAMPLHYGKQSQMAEEQCTDSTKITAFLLTDIEDCTMFSHYIRTALKGDLLCPNSDNKLVNQGMRLQTYKCMSFLTIDLTLASPSQHSPDLASLALKTNAIVIVNFTCTALFCILTEANSLFGSIQYIFTIYYGLYNTIVV